MLQLIQDRAFLQYLAIITILLVAWRWGDKPEMLSAAILFAMVPAEIGYHLLFGVGYIVSDFDIGHLLLDTTAASGFLAIALYANRMYPIWLTSFQMISVLTHLARDFSEGVTRLAYQLMVIAPSYFMMLILLGGIIRHQWRLKHHGPYRPWRTSSPQSPAPMPPFTPKV